MGPNLFMHNENSAYIMPHVTTCAVTSCAHCVAHTCRQARHPYENVACQKLLMDMLFTPAKLYLIKLTPSHFSRTASKLYLIKLTTSHFSTLNTRIANQNVLKKILIAMHNENKSDYNENFRICAEESIGPLSKW